MVALAKIGLLEISFIILLSFMLGLSGLIAFAVVVRMVDPRGAKSMSQRLIGLPRTKSSTRKG